MKLIAMAYGTARAAGSKVKGPHLVFSTRVYANDRESFWIDFVVIRLDSRLKSVFLSVCRKNMDSKIIFSLSSLRMIYNLTLRALLLWEPVFERLFQSCADALCQFAEGADPLFQKPVHGQDLQGPLFAQR